MRSKNKNVQFDKVFNILSRVDDYVLPIDEYMNGTFGKGSWKYDPYAGQYVACDQAYKGPGRGYVIVAPDTREYRIVFQDAQLH